MRHILDARLLLLAGVLAFASGCGTFALKRHTGARVSKAQLSPGAPAESHEVPPPAVKGKATKPVKAKGTVRLAAAETPAPAPKEAARPAKPAKVEGAVRLVPAEKRVIEAKKKRDEWFGRFGFLGFVYEIELDRDYGTTWALGRRVGDEGWFVEGEVTVPRAEYEFTGEEDGDRFEVEDTGRVWLYFVNVGKEFYLDEAKQYRYRFHGGLGWMNAASLTDNDTSFSATVGGAFEMRLYKNVWGHAGVSYYGFDTDLGRDTSEWRHNLGVNLSIVIDF